MNARILNNVGPFRSGRASFDFLNAVSMKLAMFFTLQKGNLVLCKNFEEIRGYESMKTSYCG
jgi:hypothetical protein